MTLMTLMTSNQSHQGNQWFKLSQLIEFQTPINFLLRYVCLMFDWFMKFAGILGIVFATVANAEDKDPFDITFYGSFLHTELVPDTLFFFNDIEEYDSFELRRAMRNHEIEFVVLASDGGSVREGLNMAAIIHDNNIKTYVPELPKGMGCYSACAFMFFGGKIRQADGLLAVHQTGFYGSDADSASAKISDIQRHTQFTVSEIIGFLNEFGTPPWVYEKMFRSRDFHEFDADEKARLALRSDEINADKLYEINGFINAFFKHLEKLETEKQEANEPKEPELSEEEELKLVVMEIQKLLNAAGCNAGVADGIWGRRTQAAAVLFAETAELPTRAEDLISEAFLEALRAAPSNFCPRPAFKKPLKPNKKVLNFTYDNEPIANNIPKDGALNGVWSWSVQCKNKMREVGSATFRGFRWSEVSEYLYTYKIRYETSSGGFGYGDITISNDGTFEFEMHNDRRQSAEGYATFNGRFKVSASDGCTYIGTRR